MSEKKTRIPASPNVRKFARELGLDINLVTGSERQGRVIENDVKKFIKDQSSKKTFLAGCKLIGLLEEDLEIWNKFKKNSKDTKQFRLFFHQWFDALSIIRLLKELNS